jgi:hypoxanthine phosphoribosyltransferase
MPGTECPPHPGLGLTGYVLGMVPPPVEEREVLAWQDFGLGCRSLAAGVVADGYRPDIILAIARGGLFVAGGLGYALSVKNVYVMNVEYYTGVNERLPLPVMLPPTPQLVDLEDTRLLIADDVADTGHTLAYVHEFCRDKVAEVRAAVLYQKPTSVIDCNYVWRRTDRWIDFPWSSEPPVVPSSEERVVRLDAGGSPVVVASRHRSP